VTDNLKDAADHFISTINTSVVVHLETTQSVTLNRIVALDTRDLTAALNIVERQLRRRLGRRLHHRRRPHRRCRCRGATHSRRTATADTTVAIAITLDITPNYSTPESSGSVRTADHQHHARSLIVIVVVFAAIVISPGHRHQPLLRPQPDVISARQRDHITIIGRHGRH